jgi:hypothetical protein
MPVVKHRKNAEDIFSDLNDWCKTEEAEKDWNFY